MISIRRIAFGAAAAAIAIAVAGCGAAQPPTWSFAPGAVTPVATTPHGAPPAVDAVRNAVIRPASLVVAARPVVHEDIAIVTGDMIGKTEYPAFVPSNLVLPANSTVVVTITNFDDATALPKGSEKYAQAAGIVGAITVQPIDLTNPNGGKGPASHVTKLAPADVSHTFTIDALGINVPIAAHARVSFVIHTGAAGHYTFRCYDPCGDGPAGWGTAMAAKGYMEGTITVQ